MDNRYVNFYQIPGSDVVTSSIHNSRKEADEIWENRWDGVAEAHRISTKQRVACIMVPCVCIFGQFDL